MASKKNLIILLLMPFAISLLSFSAITMTFNLIDNDIVAIDWNYKDNEVFALSGDKTRYRLDARAINDRNYPTGQSLVWNVYNVNSEEEEHATIYKSGEYSYLNTLSVGNVIITVSNEKGNVQKKMNAEIYSGNAIMFNTIIKGSQSNVDSNLYFGQFDISGNNKILSNIKFDVEAITERNNSGIRLISHSDNIDVDMDKSQINFTYGGEGIVDSYVTFGFTNPEYVETYTFNFKIVTGGVNVYNYNDLLWCTNKSSSGEIVVLRRNLESSDNLNAANGGNTALFGNRSGDGYNFSSEIYKFKTRFNTEYIKQWNAFANGNSKYSKISDTVNVGIRVRKDFYGNGFTINMHNLTYPYEKMIVSDQIVPKLSSANLFRGPLAYYCLGNPNNLPIVTAYGQDNIGMYIEGNNITINDLNLKSCDFGNNLANLDTVGTTMETYGNNITIKNCRLSNGKNVFKAYDSKNVTLDNCLLSYSRNFLVMTGSYQYMTVTGDELYQFTKEDGSKTLSTLNEYLGYKAEGDIALNNYMFGKNEKGHMLEAMRSLQAALDNKKSTNLMGDLTVRDTLFYRSGISSIALECLFNGPFLFNASPSIIPDTLAEHGAQLDGVGLAIPLLPKHIGGVSYPVKVTLAGKTKFYDYKTTNVLDINGLVGENISTLAASVGYEGNFTLDKIFPIKTILLEEASKRHASYNGELNSQIAFYGGGLNFSTVEYADDFEYQEHMTEIFDVDFLQKYSAIENMGEGIMANIMGAVLKAPTIVSGFNPFKFTLAKGDGYLYGEAPQIQDLIDNQK